MSFERTFKNATTGQTTSMNRSADLLADRTRTQRSQPRQLQRSLPKSGTTTLRLARDRCVLEVPLEERLQSRFSELLVWAKSMLLVINRSVRDAREQFQTGHQGIRK